MICAFRYRKDAIKFFNALPKRLDKFELLLEPEKTESRATGVRSSQGTANILVLGTIGRKGMVRMKKQFHWKRIDKVVIILLLIAVPVLSWGATISGTVRDSNGTPITGREIDVSALAGDPCGQHNRVEGTRTDPADGTYNIVVPAGTYYLQTHHIDTDYVDEWWNGNIPDPSDHDCSIAASITMATNDTVRNHYRNRIQ